MDLYRGCLCGLMLAALLCVLMTTVVDGGCAEKDQCCKGKNNKCRALGARMNKSNRTNCFCDEHCLSTGDCCTDFKDVCKSTDCVLDDWGEWGQCSKRCGWGSKERLRRVLVDRRNGGKKCGQTRQRVYCYGTKCKVERAQGGEAIRETGKIIPAMYGPWRKNKLYNPYRDIRKNLFHQYSANSIIDRPAYRARFEITEVRRGCEIHQGSGWTKSLKVGTTVCVECQPFAMKRKLGVRCKGHGVFHRETRWSAIMVSGCRGKWRMSEKQQNEGCDAEKEVSFILV